MWKWPIAFAIALALLWGISAPMPASASENRYASIIVDADTLDVLHARQIDGERFPASLTKVMTLYLVFDAIDAGTLRLDEKLTVSANAARIPPVQAGWKTGQRMDVQTLIQSVAVRSHNDSAVVLAEHLGGTEARFAQMMTEKARSLGMSKTTFKTANGLPHPDQVTTARDMAKLASAVLTYHSGRYHYFGQTEFRGQKNTNALLASRADVDGFKTGYTRASGYNLMVSATREGRRIIAVVLGGASGKSRNAHMSDLIDRGFDVISQTAAPLRVVAAKPAPKTTDTPVITHLRSNGALRPVQTAGTPITVASKTGWTVKFRGVPDANGAQRLGAALGAITGQDAQQRPSVTRQGYDVRVTGLPAKTARETCAKIDLNSLDVGRARCLIIAP